MDHSRWPICNPCSDRIPLPVHRYVSIQLWKILIIFFILQFQNYNAHLLLCLPNLHEVSVIGSAKWFIVTILCSYKLIHNKWTNVIGYFKWAFWIFILTMASAVGVIPFSKMARTFILLQIAFHLLIMTSLSSSSLRRKKNSQQSVCTNVWK